MQFAPFDCVRIVAIHDPAALEPSTFDERPPRIGDTATIVEIYTDPPGYELECSSRDDGRTLWLMAFAPDAIELERGA
jgi:hypothetical protein